MVDISFENFFDRESVKKAVGNAEAKNLSRFGSFVRTRAQSSLGARKAISSVGSPPSSHTKDLKRRILFGYEPENRAVAIGPTPYKSTSKPTGADLLEHGGTTTRNGKTYTYRARPFMQPAFDAELPKAVALFKDSIK